jgi:hypothetical protein
VDSTRINIVFLQAAGAVLASTASNPIVAKAAVIAQKLKRGGAPIYMIDDVMIASGFKQLGLT